MIRNNNNGSPETEAEHSNYSVLLGSGRLARAADRET